MKKNILFFALFLLVAVNAYADQTLNGRQPREWENSTANKPLEGKDYVDNTTTFANLVATGNQATGNPGYLGLQAIDAYGTVHTYYLWVDGSTGTGTLRMASFPAIKAYSSFPYGDWRLPNFAPGGKVASQ